MSKITKAAIKKSKRLSAIESMMFLYLKQENKTKKELKNAFYGMASMQTINGIVEVSDIIDEEKNQTLRTIHYSNITYTFSCDTDNPTLRLSGVEGKEGENIMLENIPLKGPAYEVEVTVNPNGIGNWTLKFIKIEMIEPKYERVVAGINSNTINGNNKAFFKIYKTNEK